MTDFLQCDVAGCARCGEDHHAVFFFKFDRPPPGATHWAFCPTNLDPILMNMSEAPKSK
jgi:hypothetical protein